MKENFAVLNTMKYSYSSVSSFVTCPYQFYLNYIEKRSGIPNFFSNYGSYIHSILEKYFRDELEIWDLVEYYEDHYTNYVVEPPPPYPVGMADNYYQDGWKFFESFDFDKSAYKIILIEDKFEEKENDFSWVVKPDIVLQDISTGKNILIDYKTSKLRGNKKYDDKTIAGYTHQFYLYALGLWRTKQIEINDIKIWFVRNQSVYDIPVDPIKIADNFEWFSGIIGNIKNEKEWKANNTKENIFFCHQICSFRESCRFVNS